MVPSIGSSEFATAAAVWNTVREFMEHVAGPAFRDTYFGYVAMLFLAIGCALLMWRMLMRRI